MPVIFYRSNFCPECGNPIAARRWWQHRYFCAHCAEKLSRKGDWFPLAFAVGGLALGLFFNTARRESVDDIIIHPPPSPRPAALPLVSAQDATAQLKPDVPAQAVITYQCGARTLKGTACKHRVAVQGQRCFQHQGRRSILK